MDVSQNAVGETEASGSAGSVEHEMSSIDISPAVNGGFSVRVSYRPPKASGGRGGNSPSPSYCEPDNYAFGSLQELVGFLQKELGGGEPAAPGAAPADAGADDAEY